MSSCRPFPGARPGRPRSGSLVRVSHLAGAIAECRSEDRSRRLEGVDGFYGFALQELLEFRNGCGQCLGFDSGGRHRRRLGLRGKRAQKCGDQLAERSLRRIKEWRHLLRGAAAPKSGLDVTGLALKLAGPDTSGNTLQRVGPAFRVRAAAVRERRANVSHHTCLTGRKAS